MWHGTRAQNLYFYPRSPYGERPRNGERRPNNREISIHALLTESDRCACNSHSRRGHFYPRSPYGERRLIFCRCNRRLHYFYPRSPYGERRSPAPLTKQKQHISIHALLTESDLPLTRNTTPNCEFLSTLSLRRATLIFCRCNRRLHYFYPRSPYGERRGSFQEPVRKICIISIHALLTESDQSLRALIFGRASFLSTLSLRRATPPPQWKSAQSGFLSTLSLRRATHPLLALTNSRSYFYPRSPYGERQSKDFSPPEKFRHFYPRSPYGERPSLSNGRIYKKRISIHALLTESDDRDKEDCKGWPAISIHALLTESDKIVAGLRSHTPNFYPRSPYGERLHYDNYNLHCVEISIHALLTESDRRHRGNDRRPVHFYPRSPYGERRANSRGGRQGQHISIHALLTESDLSMETLRQVISAISIHALLTESDFRHCTTYLNCSLFLSTLSLRRATAPQISVILII